MIHSQVTNNKVCEQPHNSCYPRSIRKVNHMTTSKLYFLFAVMVCFTISGCSNVKSKADADVENTTAADTNVFEGSFWRNQALTDIMPYWIEHSLDTVDGAFVTNFDR